MDPIVRIVVLLSLSAMAIPPSAACCVLDGRSAAAAVHDAAEHGAVASPSSVNHAGHPHHLGQSVVAHGQRRGGSGPCEAPDGPAGSDCPSGCPYQAGTITGDDRRTDADAAWPPQRPAVDDVDSAAVATLPPTPVPAVRRRDLRRLAPPATAPPRPRSRLATTARLRL